MVLEGTGHEKWQKQAVLARDTYIRGAGEIVAYIFKKKKHVETVYGMCGHGPTDICRIVLND